MAVFWERRPQHLGLRFIRDDGSGMVSMLLVAPLLDVLGVCVCVCAPGASCC